MTSIEDHVWGERTRAIHAGGRPDPTTGARQVPIYQTTSFVFEDVEDAADLFALQKYGNIYTRLGNPTVAVFEERVASVLSTMRGTPASLATAETAAMSVMIPPGLAIDSMKIALVFGVTARSKVEMSSGSAHTTFQPKLLKAWLN